MWAKKEKNNKKERKNFSRKIAALKNLFELVSLIASIAFVKNIIFRNS